MTSTARASSKRRRPCSPTIATTSSSSTSASPGSSGTEGFDLIDSVRERNPRTPIILLTAHSSPQVERHAVALGASLVLEKPALLPDVADAIRNLLERTQ